MATEPLSAECEAALAAIKALESKPGVRVVTVMVAREVTQLIPSLCIGGKPAANSVLEGEAAELGITDVLSCTFDEEGRPPEDELRRAGVLALNGFWCPDDEEVDLLGLHYEECQKLYVACKERDGRMLVHCNWGKNRSALVCAALLIDVEELRLMEAVELLFDKRGMVLLGNENFCRRLVLFAAERDRL
eukprot:TRINITY_DN61045_c0_g1_i1.p1 TRINITY_DN61045_c0_g1~~TRINITY_DN61045_c0_g1_i1.p1  ORF type:complete len:190 (-),score=38.54 TRINITY_DN61045_c0_g1_i1:88-657(-)